MSHNYVKITDPTFLLVCFMELLPGPTSQQFPSCPGIKSGWLNNSNHFGMDKPNAKDTQENVWTATKASCQLFIDKRFNVIRVGSKKEEEKSLQYIKDLTWDSPAADSLSAPLSFPPTHQRDLLCIVDIDIVDTVDIVDMASFSPYSISIFFIVNPISTNYSFTVLLPSKMVFCTLDIGLYFLFTYDARKDWP